MNANNIYRLTHNEVTALAVSTASQLNSLGLGASKVYPIPRGGVPAAYLVARYCNIQIVELPAEADVFLDDIIDSGATVQKWCDEFPGHAFFALDRKSTRLNSSHHSSRMPSSA